MRHETEGPDHPGFNTPEWQEHRLDIDRKVDPDIVGTMIDMAAVADSSHRPALATGNFYLAHRTGFPLRSLIAALRESGFSTVIGRRQPAPAYALWIGASKSKQPESV